MRVMNDVLKGNTSGLLGTFDHHREVMGSNPKPSACKADALPG